MTKNKLALIAVALLAAVVVAIPVAAACGDNSGSAGKAAARPAPAAAGPAGGQAKGQPPAGKKPDAPARTATASAITDANGYKIELVGGYDTDPQDHGRPVVLIAAALGVPTEVFRTAFSGVTPAGANSGGPTTEEAQANKAALMKVLAPYGITNDRLDEVSNYYRYNGSKGEVWTQTAAVLETVVKNGAVTGIVIKSAGAGYSSAPTVKITGPDGKTLTAKTTVAYSTDLKTNGKLATVALN